MICYNPFAFVPIVVTLTTAIVYLAIFIPLIVIHETVPSAPKNPTVYRGLNLTEAWLDLAERSTRAAKIRLRRVYSSATADDAHPKSD